MISRELYDAKDRAKNFYMMGSMGHIAAFAMGFAHKRKDLKTFVFDGDGSLLMHSGVLSSIGHEAPKNLYHVLKYKIIFIVKKCISLSDVMAVFFISRSIEFSRCEIVSQREISIWEC